MNRVLRKLRSQKGASITFALLLFLICAIISSIVIVAGTSAAGRLSGMSESEQRYYSVSSVAKLIEDRLDGQTATIMEIVDADGNTIARYIGTGTLKPIDGANTELNALPEYLAYQINTGGTGGSLAISGDNSDQIKKAIGDEPGNKGNKPVSIIETIEGKDIKFSISRQSKNEKDTYSIALTFSTSEEKTTGIEIAGGEEGTTGEETVYTWSLKEARVQ